MLLFQVFCKCLRALKVQNLVSSKQKCLSNKQEGHKKTCVKEREIRIFSDAKSFKIVFLKKINST